jgi:hypothetical protein
VASFRVEWLHCNAISNQHLQGFMIDVEIFELNHRRNRHSF